MSFRGKIFFGFLFIGSVALYVLSSWVVRDLKPGYRKATEEQLVDTAEILAALAETSIRDGKIQVDLFQQLFEKVRRRELHAAIFDFTKSAVELRVYITDAKGIVLFDTRSPSEVGKDYSQWRDVRLVLEGKYGARTTKEGDDENSVMYVAAPVSSNGAVAGVLSVGKSSTTVNLFVLQARDHVFAGGIAVLAAVILVGFLLSHMVSEPVRRLTHYAQAVGAGKREPLPRLGRGELRHLGNTLEQMRDTLEGKRYIERYVETLTHELKSPLAAIAGAVELLKSNPPAEDRNRFCDNIRVETERMKSVIDQLLLLSVIEARKGLTSTVTIDPIALCDEILGELRTNADQKRLTVECEAKLDSQPAAFAGERTLVKEALRNIVQNAIEFSPRGSRVTVRVEKTPEGTCFLCEDSGPGVPDYALERVFERFYSLPRPDSGKKSSGLGLSIVREIAELHGGTVALSNRKPSGAAVRIVFPA